MRAAPLLLCVCVFALNVYASPKDFVKHHVKRNLTRCHGRSKFEDTEDAWGVRGSSNHEQPPDSDESTSSSQPESTTTSSADSDYASPTQTGSSDNSAPMNEGRPVFAHYMLVTPPVDLDYAPEIKLAQKTGIDAFAVNYGGWGNDFDQQDEFLSKIFAAAEDNDFKLFLSMDMTSVSDGSMIVDIITKYADSPAHYLLDDKLFLSTFQETDSFADVSFDWQKDVIEPIEKKTGKSVVFVPGTYKTDVEQLFSDDFTDGVFSWPHQSMSIEKDQKLDQSFADTAASSDKMWMASVAPWFFKHYSSDMNWGNQQDNDIFVTRFQNLLKMDVDLLELVTWNDYGESSYFGVADTEKRYVDWAYLSHDGFREMAALFIKAFKTGKKNVMDVEDIDNQVFMFYRTQPYDSQGTEDDLGPPADADQEDSIFVVSFLHDSAKVTVNNGGKETEFTAESGVNMKAVPFQAGSVTLKATTPDGKTIADKKGPEISEQLSLTNANAVCI